MVRPAYELEKVLKRDAEQYKGDLSEINTGVIVGYMNKFLGGDDHRYIVLGYLFSYKQKAEGGDGVLRPMSSKELTPGQWFALHRWLGMYKNEDTGKWCVQEDFVEEAKLLLNDAMATYGVAGAYADMPELLEEAERLGGLVTPNARAQSRFFDIGAPKNRKTNNGSVNI